MTDPIVLTINLTGGHVADRLDLMRDMIEHILVPRDATPVSARVRVDEAVYTFQLPQGADK